MGQRLHVALCLLVLCSMLPLNCLAWGETGHRIVAQIAQDLLTEETWDKLVKLLPPGYSLADIAPWADDYANSLDGGWTYPMHFLNNPTNATQYYKKYCPPHISCVVAAVRNFTGIALAQEIAGNSMFCHDYGYANVSNSDAVPQPCPLAFMVHFIGDIHEPLHVGYEVDTGGNDFVVQWYGETTDLHHVWDDKIIYKILDDSDITWEVLADDILDYLEAHPGTIEKYQEDTDSEHWANEGFYHVRTSCYNFPPGTTSPTAHWLGLQTNARWIASETGVIQLGDPYYVRNAGLVLRQLAAAGCRLAQILNNVYGLPHGIA